MSFLRFAARGLIASSFIVDGVQEVLRPSEHAEDAAFVQDRVVPLAQKVVPAQAASYIPEETKTLAQVGGAVKIAAGAGFGLGIFRRVSAGLLAATAIPSVVTAARHIKGSDDKGAARADLLRTMSLLGAMVLASQDTQGKPSLGWRAHDGQRRLARRADETSTKAKKLSRKAKKELQKASKRASKQVQGALN